MAKHFFIVKFAILHISANMVDKNMCVNSVTVGIVIMIKLKVNVLNVHLENSVNIVVE